MRNKLTNELAVCGLNAVSALGEYHPNSINRLFLREDQFALFTGVCKNLAARKRPYKICPDDELERICKSPRHQGVVAMIEEPAVAPISGDDLDFWAREGKTGLVLHSVGNDHNLGAMVRSAAFFDVFFVVISQGDAAARLTTSAYRVAEGGMEHVNFRSVRNTAAFIKSASKCLVTIGTDVRARWRVRVLDAIIREKTSALNTRDYPLKGPAGVALVMGNEESGLPQEIQIHCSALVRIPGTGLIESLNVAQAATVFLHELYAR
ncbi:MAG: RNA methyltransferase [Spirochaetaceae bacterium]|jgi:TrmH RNA methyltransferase|nr:RNA methyltransferase [Spirochaetaceae bacterium]